MKTTNDIDVPDGFSEAYESLRTVELVSDHRTFRIEVVRDLRTRDLPFSVRYTEQCDDGPWVRLPDMPSVRQGTEGDALRQAMSWLNGRLAQQKR